MEEVTDNDSLEVIEWTIVNFSCWNEDIHGDVIESREFERDHGVSLKLELHPKVTAGKLMANIIFYDPVYIIGDFSFIGPDGSILGSFELNSDSDDLVALVAPFGFDGVVAHIRKNEDIHEDRLTLKLRIKCDCNNVLLARTEIVTHRSSWKISSQMFKVLTSSDLLWISTTFYPLDDDSMGKMGLGALGGDSGIQLLLDHELTLSEDRMMENIPDDQKKILVFLNVSVRGNDGAVMVTEEKKCVMFQDVWKFWKSPPLTKESKEEFSLILRVKIVPSVKYKHQSWHYMPKFVSRHCLVAPSYHQSQN